MNSPKRRNWLILALPIFLATCAVSREAEAAHGCERAIGNWLWDARQFPATLQPGGNGHGFDNGQTIYLTWQCTDPWGSQITVRWSTGFVDTLYLSTDGNTLDGHNNSGNRVFARRNAPSPYPYPSPNPSPGPGCGQAAGNWEWDLRRFPATVHGNGRMSGYDNGVYLTGSWYCADAYRREIVVQWSSGITDRLRLSYDGTTLEGSNSLGNRVIAWRRY